MTAVAATAPVRKPDALDRLGESLAERLNPIIVKEVRQGLRARVFWIFFSLLLAACVVISIFVWAVNDGTEGRAGQYTFIAYSVVLSVVQFFVIPYSAFRSMAREREDETWVLLTLTGLGPRRILAGKLGSYIAQGALYASATTPFLVFCYQLNGIDLPTILVAVVTSAAYLVFLTVVSVCTATLAESRLARGLLHFLLLGFLVQSLVAGITLTVTFTEGMSRIGKVTELWLGAAALLFFMVSTGVLLFEAAAARLALATEDYAKGPRLAWLAQLVGMALLAALAALVAGDEEPLLVAGVAAGMYVGVVGVFLVSDRDSMAHGHWVRSSRWSLLRPGAFRGYLLVLLAALTVTAGLGTAYAMGLGGGSNIGELLTILTTPGYALLYLSAAVLLARWIPHPPAQTPAIVRLVFLGLVVAGMGLPPLFGAMTSDPMNAVLNLFNPVLGLVIIAKEGDDGVWLTVMVWLTTAPLVALTLATLRARDVERKL